MKGLVVICLFLFARSVAAQDEWEKIEVPASSILNFDVVGEHIYVLDVSDQYNVCHSSSNGLSWESYVLFPKHITRKEPMNGGVSLVEIKALAPDLVFVSGSFNDDAGGCFTQDGGLFFRTTTFGRTWDTLPPSFNNNRGGQYISFVLDTIFLVKQAGFVCGDWGDGPELYVSFDRGDTFRDIAYDPFGLEIAIRDNKRIARLPGLLSQSRGLILTSNSGLTWDTVLRSNKIHEIRSSANYWMARGWEDSIWYSAEGSEWTFDPNFRLYPDEKIHYQYSNDSLFISTDSAKSFSLHSVLPGSIARFVTSSDVLYVQIGDTAIYRYPSIPRSVEMVDSVDFINNSILLFPNPAQDKLTLSWIGGERLVEIYDLSGHRVKGEMMQPGQAWDISTLSSGSYVVQVNGAIANFRVVR